MEDFGATGVWLSTVVSRAPSTICSSCFSYILSSVIASSVLPIDVSGVRLSTGKERLGFGGTAIFIMAPNRTVRKFGFVPKPSSVSSLIEVSPSAFSETADE